MAYLMLSQDELRIHPVRFINFANHETSVANLYHLLSRITFSLLF